MATKPRPIPEGYHTLTPYLAVDDAALAIDFYKRAFGATETVRMPGPDGKVGHAELLIGDSVVMVKDARDDQFNALLCTYWPDVDAAWDRAVRAGARAGLPRSTLALARRARRA